MCERGLAASLVVLSILNLVPLVCAVPTFIHPNCSSSVEFRGASNFIVSFALVLPMRYIRPGVIWFLLGNGAWVVSLFLVEGRLHCTFSSCRLVVGVFSSNDENHACFLTVGDSRSINTWSLLQLPAAFSCVVPMVRYLRLFKVMSSWFSGWVSL